MEPGRLGSHGTCPGLTDTPKGDFRTSTDKRVEERREGFMRVDTFTTMLLPAIAIALAIIILKPMLRDSLFVDPR
jgi:hypothetical protein